MFIIFWLLSQSQYGILNDLYEILIFYYSLPFFKERLYRFVCFFTIVKFMFLLLLLFFFKILNIKRHYKSGISRARTIFKYCARHSKPINDSTYRLIPTNLLENLRLQSPKKLLFLFNRRTGKFSRNYQSQTSSIRNDTFQRASNRD